MRKSYLSCAAFFIFSQKMNVHFRYNLFFGQKNKNLFSVSVWLPSHRQNTLCHLVMPAKYTASEHFAN